MPDGATRRDHLRGAQDRLRVDPIMAVKIGNRARLAEVLDAERARSVAHHGTDPGECRRMCVDDGDQAAMGRDLGKQALDMARGVHEASLAGPLSRGPAGVEPVGRGHCKKANVSPVLGDQADRFDGLRGNSSGISHDDLRVRPGPAQPIRPIDDVVAQRRVVDSQVQLGDEVVLLGAQGRERITAEELARHAETIGYEIVCATALAARRGRRVYVDQ